LVVLHFPYGQTDKNGETYALLQLLIVIACKRASIPSIADSDSYSPFETSKLTVTI